MDVLRKRMQLPVVLALLAAAGSVACARGGVRVVVITLDTLRYDSFAGTVANGSQMPRTREWAEHATIFDRFYASTATTQPTHASLFTGLHPWEHGITRNGVGMAAHHVTVAETLSSAGFGTYAVVASYPVHHVFGFDQGFDVYRDDFLPAGPGGQGADSPVDVRDQSYFLAETVTDTALELLDHADEDKQFFWVHYYDPHPPYGDSGDGETLYPKNVQEFARDGDARHLLERSRELYDDDVRYLDNQLDRLLRRLSSDEGRVRTHVVVTADHGEAFGEGGSVGHGARLLPATIHVPMVIRSSLAEPGVRSDVASTVDLTATLFALAGVERSTPRGRVLLDPPADNDGAVGMRRTYEEPFAEIRMDGKRHFVYKPLFFHVDSRGRLVRGNSQRILEPVPPAYAEELRARFLAFEQELASRSNTRIAPGAREALRALGYAP